MTGEAFAALVDARRAGPGKWSARCPAHADRSPSLSIRETDGRVLLHCFAGCEHTAILAALGLTGRDLYSGPMPSPTEQEALRRVREVREQKTRERRIAHGAACDRVRRWEAIRDALGHKLMLSPENDGPAGAFERALTNVREAEAEEERLRGGGA